MKIKFKTYEEAEEYFNKLEDKAKVLSVMYPSLTGKEEYKQITFYNDDITLKEQKEFEKKFVNEEIKSNTNFFPKSKKKEFEEKLENKKEILELLDEKESQVQYLDLGEINGMWYYGFMLKGKEAIITNSGKIFRNTLREFKGKMIGTNEIKELFDYEGYLGDIAPLIAKKAIKKFYMKNHRNHLINPKEIYIQIRDKILYYMDFSGADEIADVLTCWIIATYCYPLFYWFPHILINAPTQSGKTKGGYIIIQMAFRGFDLGASGGVSPPQIFRTLEGNRGTILIDEFERTKGNSNVDTQQLVNQLLNASASRDAYVIRVEKIDGKWKSKKFPISCPKIACNISGINPTSLSRYIPFSWLKTKSEKTKRKPQRRKDLESFKPIRESLYLLILENWKKIKEIYDNLDIFDLVARDEDNWLPLYSIAKFIDSFDKNLCVKEKLDLYHENLKEIQIDTEDSTEDFFRILYEKVSDSRYYTPKEIGEWVEIQDLLPHLKSPAHWVGKTLKSYKFKSNRGGGIRKYLLSKDSVNKIVDVYFDKNIITSNDTIDIQQHNTTHKDTTKQISNGNVSLGGICAITPHISDNKIDFSKSRIKEIWKKDKLSFCYILESALLNFDGVSEEELIQKYNIPKSLAKAGTSLFVNELNNPESDGNSKRKTKQISSDV